MAAAKRTKASDKQGICKKIVTVLKKRYGGSIPKSDRPIMETIVYAVCLENATVEEANAAYERLGTTFFDWNEARVSTITELERVFASMVDPEWRAFRIRTVLNYIFETHYKFDLELLRRKTLDLANKELTKISDLTPFVRNYTLQTTLGGHLVPVDERMLRAAIWLGLTPPGTTERKASGNLKSAVRKANVSLFCHLLRKLANDSTLGRAFKFDPAKADAEAFDLMTAPDRLIQLFEKPKPRAKKKTAKKSAPRKKTPKKKATTRKPAAKKKSPVKKKKAATGRATKKKTARATAR